MSMVASKYTNVVGSTRFNSIRELVGGDKQSLGMLFTAVEIAKDLFFSTCTAVLEYEALQIPYNIDEIALYQLIWELANFEAYLAAWFEAPAGGLTGFADELIPLVSAPDEASPELTEKVMVWAGELCSDIFRTRRKQ